MTDVRLRAAKSILTPQTSGFLTTPPYPFTHSLNPYIGCGFGKMTCGQFCYAASLASWRYEEEARGKQWGDVVVAKQNAAKLLDDALRAAKEKRRLWRIFMSATTDPYQPAEGHHKITQGLLSVFANYLDKV